MIVLNLCCGNAHRFEGWFSSNDDYSAQLGREMLSCPVCGDRRVKRLPSGPYVKRGERSAAPPPKAEDGQTSSYAALKDLAFEVIEHLLNSSEDVGGRFVEEARKIHNSDAPQRNIRGVATRDEANALLDEGIPVVPLPIPPKSEMH